MLNHVSNKSADNYDCCLLLRCSLIQYPSPIYIVFFFFFLNVGPGSAGEMVADQRHGSRRCGVLTTHQLISRYSTRLPGIKLWQSFCGN